MCVTIKDSSIDDGNKLPRHFACSIYYTNPAHILSTVTEKVAWTKKENMG